MIDTTVVMGKTTFLVRSVHVRSARTMKLTLTRDGRDEWSFDVPQWRGISVGFGRCPYIWSARDVVTLPQALTNDPEVIGFDEDLLLVFQPNGCWIAVCETSVRLLSGDVETDRIELGEVVEHARWDGERLVVNDAAGGSVALAVFEGRLIPV